MKYIPILFSTEMVKALLDGRKTQTRRKIKLPSPQGEFPAKWFYEKYDVPFVGFELEHRFNDGVGRIVTYRNSRLPYGQPGGILWVKESHYAYGYWKKNGTTKTGKQKWRFVQDKAFTSIAYTDNPPYKVEKNTYRNTGWYKRSSLFMSKESARIFLQVKDVRVQKLQDISPDDACDEGIEYWNIDAEAMEGGELQADFNNYTWTEKKEQDPNYEDRYFPTFGNPVDSFRTLWQSINGHDSWSVNPWVWVISFERIDKPKTWPL